MFSLESLFCHVDDLCKAFEMQMFNEVLNVGHDDHDNYFGYVLLVSYSITIFTRVPTRCLRQPDGMHSSNPSWNSLQSQPVLWVCKYPQSTGYKLRRFLRH